MKFIQFKVICLSLVLTACGGGKVINTSDDSADYQSARDLPPLKKTLSTTNSNSLETATTDQRSLVATENINFSIVDAAKDRKRLRINANFDSAWVNLLEQVRNSAVTIHSRSKSAARIEVGCGEIDDGVDSDNDTGWSLRSRGSLIYDYCVLELSQSGGDTIVAVQNRRGDEVSGTEALTLLQEIVR